MAKRIFKIYADRRLWDMSTNRCTRITAILDAVQAGEEVTVWAVPKRIPYRHSELPPPVNTDVTRQTLMRALVYQERLCPELTIDQIRRLIRGEVE